jgi:hypothetical protein
MKENHAAPVSVHHELVDLHPVASIPPTLTLDVTAPMLDAAAAVSPGGRFGHNFSQVGFCLTQVHHSVPPPHSYSLTQIDDHFPNP